MDDHHAAGLLLLVKQFGKECTLHCERLANDQLRNQPLFKLQLAEYKVLLVKVMTLAEGDAAAEEQEENEEV